MSNLKRIRLSQSRINIEEIRKVERYLRRRAEMHNPKWRWPLLLAGRLKKALGE